MPTSLPDGTVLPDPVNYVAVAARLTQPVDPTGVPVGAPRPPIDSEPAADVNTLNGGVSAVVSAFNALLAALQAAGSTGVKAAQVWDAVSSKYVSGAVYVGPTDPATLTPTPSGSYAHLNTSALSGARRWNATTGDWDVLPLYIDSVDPATRGVKAPKGDYFWLDTSGGA